MKAVAGTGIVLSAAGFYLQTRALRSDVAALEIQSEGLRIDKERLQLELEAAERDKREEERLRQQEERQQEAEKFERAERLFQLANTVCTLADPDEINSRLKLLTGITGAEGIDARFCLSYRGGASFRGEFAFPVDASAEFSDGFGLRRHPILNTTRMHAGIDWTPGKSDTIFAAADGIVVFAEVAEGYGRRIIVDHGNNWRTTYSHLATIGCSVGEIVLAGQAIGRMGASGRASAKHVHFEVLAAGDFRDPAKHLPTECAGPACPVADGG